MVRYNIIKKYIFKYSKKYKEVLNITNIYSYIKMIPYVYYMQLMQSLEDLCDVEKCAQLVFELRMLVSNNCSFLMDAT